MNQNNQHSDDRAERSLQEELRRMAAETPEMPDSFRRGWRQAIRQDAEAKGTTPAQESQTSRGPLDSNITEIKPARRISARARRGLSIAAVAAFLLGGTLLGQERATLTQATQANTVTAAQEAAEQNTAVPAATSAPIPETVMEEEIILTASSMDAAPVYDAEEDAEYEKFSLAAGASMDGMSYDTEEDAEYEEADAAEGGIAVETSINAASEAAAISSTAVPAAKLASPESTMTTKEPETAPARSTSPLHLIGEILIGLSLLCLVLLFTFRN